MRVQQPSPAERARTVLRLSPYLRVRVPGAGGEVGLHGTDPDGSVVLVVPDDHPVARAVRPAADSLPVLVDATDLCPVPVADRVRGRVRLVGWVHEPPAHLRRELALAAADREGAGALLDIGNGRTVLYVDVAEVQLVDGSADPDEVAAVVSVDRQDYAAAAPDPLAGLEAALLGHLLDDHPAELDRLAGLLPADARAGGGRVVPVRLDRHGLLLRAGGADVRLPFAEPLTCPRQLPSRMRELLASARRAAVAAGRRTALTGAAAAALDSSLGSEMAPPVDRRGRPCTGVPDGGVAVADLLPRSVQSDGMAAPPRPLVPAGAAQELAAQFAGVARALAAEQTVEETLGRLVELAVAIIPGCHHAGVTVVRRGRPETPAATDEVPAAVDAIQYETGQGPCLSAIEERAVFRTGDLARDSRWPAFAQPAAERTGVRSILAYRLFTEEDTLGALNLYSRERDAFGDDAVPIGTILAAHAALAFAQAREREQISGLEQALSSNRTIAMAIGILMASHRIKEGEAFDLLRVASQRSNRRLREIAEEVVRTGELHDPAGKARDTP